MTVQTLAAKIEARRGRLDTYTKHWHGEAPATFLSKDSREAMENKVRHLGVNMPRLAITSMTDRLKVQGFRAQGEETADKRLGQLSRQMNLRAVADLVHTTRALYGSAYLTVWTSERTGRPIAIAESPLTAAVERDPATGEVLAGMRTWKDGDESWAAYFTQTTVTLYKSQNLAAGGQWEQQGKTEDHPLGIVPIVPFIREQGVGDIDGTSLVADILDLTDALSKVLADGMVSSEYHAKPRRWATGLEIQEDEDGNPIDPFGNGRFLQSEDPETKFGQLPATGPNAYTELVATLTQQIGAIACLPPHYLGLHGDQPANADGVKAAEAQLVARCYSEMRQLDISWGMVAALISSIDNSALDALELDYLPVWDSPEINTPAQAADAAVKLQSIGVPLRSLLAQPLDYEPHQIEAIMANQRTEQVQRAGTDIGKLL